MTNPQHVEPIFDTADEQFWLPDNWPFLKAPVRREFKPMPRGRVHVYLTLWMRLGRDWPDAFPQPDGLKRGEDGLEHWGTTVPLADVDAAVAEGTQYLTDERDRELHGGLAMATNELLEALR